MSLTTLSNNSLAFDVSASTVQLDAVSAGLSKARSGIAPARIGGDRIDVRSGL
jgi:hypothetical protein